MHALGLKSLYLPFGRSFIELIGVADRALAARTTEGRFIIEAVEAGRTWVGWCIATDDLDPILARTGCTPVRGFTAAEDGAEHAWRTACTHVSMTDPGLPFFLEWQHADRYPGLGRAEHRVRHAEITEVEVGVDEQRLKAWAGEDLPWVRADGDSPPGVQAVRFVTENGPVTLR